MLAQECVHSNLADGDGHCGHGQVHFALDLETVEQFVREPQQESIEDKQEQAQREDDGEIKRREIVFIDDDALLPDLFQGQRARSHLADQQLINDINDNGIKRRVAVQDHAARNATPGR